MMVFNDSSQNFFFYFYILWLIYCFFNHKKRKDRAWSRKNLCPQVFVTFIKRTIVKFELYYSFLFFLDFKENFTFGFI